MRKKHLRFKDFLGYNKDYIYNITDDGNYVISKEYFSLIEVEDSSNSYLSKTQNIARTHNNKFSTILNKISECNLRSLFKRILKNKKIQGSVCDIGFGDGKALQFFEKLGCNIYGFEPNKDKYNRAVNKLKSDKNIYNTLFNIETIGKTKFDYVLLIHVMEHIYDYNNLLSNISQILMDNGKIILSVPNVESLQRKITGKHWFHACAPLHIFQYNIESLDAIMKRHNFIRRQRNIIDIRDSQLGWIQSCYNLLPGSENFLFRYFQKLGFERKSIFAKMLLVGDIVFLPLILILSATFFLIEVISGEYTTLNLIYEKS